MFKSHVERSDAQDLNQKGSKNFGVELCYGEGFWLLRVRYASRLFLRCTQQLHFGPAQMS